MIRVCCTNCYPLDKRQKLDVQKTLRGYPERLLNLLRTLNLHHVFQWTAAVNMLLYLHKKIKFSTVVFHSSKCDQIHSSLRIWSHLLKKSLMESFIFSAVYIVTFFKNYDFFFHTLFNVDKSIFF